MKVYWIDGEYLGIADYNFDDDSWTNLTDEVGLNMRIERIAKAAHFILPKETATYTRTQESEIPEDYHEALIYKVFKYMYEGSVSTINLAQYNKNEYNELVKKAKKEARKRKSSTGRIAPVDY